MAREFNFRIDQNLETCELKAVPMDNSRSIYDTALYTCKTKEDATKAIELLKAGFNAPQIDEALGYKIRGKLTPNQLKYFIVCVGSAMASESLHEGVVSALTYATLLKSENYEGVYILGFESIAQYLDDKHPGTIIYT